MQLRHFVFVFENDEPIMTIDGIGAPSSFLVQAEDLDSAIDKLIELRDGIGSDDPDDYKADIDEGNITVLVPSS